ncbi:MAG: patatin-like phospholipase family protein [Nocardioidaceae bacterium]
MTRVGLVLGAGGVVGQAYHAGVLAAVEHDLHWDPRTVELIVGTSAGAITGTLLRSGVPASELAAWSVRAPLTAEGKLLETLFGVERPQFEPFRVLDLVRRPPSLPGWHMIHRALLRPWHFRPMTAALTLLAPGPQDIAERLVALREVESQGWPEQELWICAVRRRDGRRVVFGRAGAPVVPLHLAVASSCAVPGYFAPVHIGDHSYVDGGAHSPTNAATLRDRSLDLVIIVSPMSGPSRLPRDVYGASRLHAARIARREARALRAQGTSVVVFRPGDTVQRLMGNNFMSGEHLDQIVRESFLAAGAYAAQPEVRELLAGIAS